MNGGKLIQHMNHPNEHHIITSTGEVLEATSTHHQMQYPYLLPKDKYELLAWGDELSNCHLDGNNQHIEFPKFAYHEGKMMEPEIVYYPETNCLGIQMHPEYWNINEKNLHPTLVYLRNLLNTKLKLNNNIEEQVIEKVV